MAGREKRFMFVNRRAPHGTIYAQESLEVVLISAAFDQRVCLAFIDDGVFQLRRAQDTSAIGTRGFAATYGALADYEVTEIYVERESLEERGMREADLMELWHDEAVGDGARRSSIQVLDRAELAGLMATQDVLLGF